MIVFFCSYKKRQLLIVTDELCRTPFPSTEYDTRSFLKWNIIGLNSGFYFS